MTFEHRAKLGDVWARGSDKGTDAETWTVYVFTEPKDGQGGPYWQAVSTGNADRTAAAFAIMDI